MRHYMSEITQKTVYRNIILVNFVVPLITSILAVAAVIFTMTYVFNIFSFENPWNNYVYRWIMIVNIVATNIYNLGNITYKRLCSYDATVTISAQSWSLVYGFGTVLYVALFYTIFRTMHSSIKSLMYATMLYALFVGSIAFGKFLEQRRRLRTIKS